MFDIVVAKATSAFPKPVIDVCALCEHRHPQGCNFCDLNVDKPANNDPWWPREDVREKINVASGEDVSC